MSREALLKYSQKWRKNTKNVLFHILFHILLFHLRPRAQGVSAQSTLAVQTPGGIEVGSRFRKLWTSIDGTSGIPPTTLKTCQVCPCRASYWTLQSALWCLCNVLWADHTLTAALLQEFPDHDQASREKNPSNLHEEMRWGMGFFFKHVSTCCKVKIPEKIRFNSSLWNLSLISSCKLCQGAAANLCPSLWIRRSAIAVHQQKHHWRRPELSCNGPSRWSPQFYFQELPIFLFVSKMNAEHTERFKISGISGICKPCFIWLMCILRQSLIACAAGNVVDTKLKQTRKLTSSGHRFFVSCTLKLVRKNPSIKLFASQAWKKNAVTVWPVNFPNSALQRFMRLLDKDQSSKGAKENCKENEQPLLWSQTKRNMRANEWEGGWKKRQTKDKEKNHWNSENSRDSWWFAFKHSNFQVDPPPMTCPMCQNWQLPHSLDCETWINVVWYEEYVSNSKRGQRYDAKIRKVMWQGATQ